MKSTYKKQDPIIIPCEFAGDITLSEDTRWIRLNKDDKYWTDVTGLIHPITLDEYYDLFGDDGECVFHCAFPLFVREPKPPE